MNATTLVREILGTGKITQAKIASRINKSQSIISALNTGKYGKRTPYDTVIALKALRDELCGAVAVSKDQPQVTA